jgi:hypothetical protein
VVQAVEQRSTDPAASLAQYFTMLSKRNGEVTKISARRTFNRSAPVSLLQTSKEKRALSAFLGGQQHSAAGAMQLAAEMSAAGGWCAIMVFGAEGCIFSSTVDTVSRAVTPVGAAGLHRVFWHPISRAPGLMPGTWRQEPGLRPSGIEFPAPGARHQAGGVGDRASKRPPAPGARHRVFWHPISCAPALMPGA